MIIIMNHFFIVLRNSFFEQLKFRIVKDDEEKAVL